VAAAGATPASSPQGAPTRRHLLGWALGGEGGLGGTKRGPQAPYLTRKASTMRGGGAVMSGGGTQLEEATRSRVVGSVSFSGTPQSLSSWRNGAQWSG
jgi:hypothetical protein